MKTSRERYLIVDDESLARRGVRDLLEEAGVNGEIVEAASGREAVRHIRECRPDIVFLDIQMPALDGFGVIEEVGVDAMPPVVFITAHDEHAVRAFEAHAIDYLLKPVAPERFRAALARARVAATQQGMEALRAAIGALMASARTHSARTTGTIAVRERDRVVFLKRDEIGWVEADANYVRVHAAGTAFRHRATLEHMESILGEGFVRISRTALVRIGAIRYCEPWGRGSYQFVLHDRTRVVSSRHYRDRVLPVVNGADASGQP